MSDPLWKWTQPFRHASRSAGRTVITLSDIVPRGGRAHCYYAMMGAVRASQPCNRRRWSCESAHYINNNTCSRTAFNIKTLRRLSYFLRLTNLIAVIDSDLCKRSVGRLPRWFARWILKFRIFQFRGGNDACFFLYIHQDSLVVSNLEENPLFLKKLDGVI